MVSSISAYSLGAPVFVVWKRWFKPGSSSTSKCLLPPSSNAFLIVGRFCAGETCRSFSPFNASTGQVTLRQCRRGVVGEEVAEPRRGQGLNRIAELGIGHSPRGKLLAKLLFKRRAILFLFHQSEQLALLFGVLLDLFLARAAGLLDRRPCSTMIRSPGTPEPAIMTTNAMAGFLAATIGPMIPPSLWPTRPILRGSTSERIVR